MKKIDFNKSNKSDIVAWFDGACKNVKDELEPMGVGVLIKKDDEIIVSKAISPDILGTSNVAEYIGLVTTLREVLNYIQRNKDKVVVTDVLIHSDSQLVVNHYHQNWQCRNGVLKSYLDEALSLSNIFKKLDVKLTLKWVRRNFNTEADELSKFGHQDSILKFSEK